MEIRPLEHGDADGYVRLLREIDLESRFLMWEPGERQVSPEDIRHGLAAFDRSARLRLVATADDALVGFLVAHRGELKRLHHRADFTMAVLRAHWARGIGTGLLDALDDWARAVGVSRLELTVMSTNDRAIALYERAGYAVEGRKRAAVLVEGDAVDEVVMGKLLAQ